MINRYVMSMVSLAVLGISILVIFPACSEKPVTSLNATEQALQEARKAGAQEYASETLKLAEDQFQKAREEMEMQEISFALLRNYKTAEELLAKAKMDAEKAVLDANTAKMQAKSDAEAAVTLARTILTEARTILAQAPVGKGSQADLQALKGDLEAADSINAELDLALGHEDYLGVKAKAQAMQNLSARVHDQVASALKKAGRSKA